MVATIYRKCKLASIWLFWKKQHVFCSLDIHYLVVDFLYQTLILWIKCYVKNCYIIRIMNNFSVWLLMWYPKINVLKLFHREQRIIKKWQDLLQKLENLKITLSGFNNFMNMFREIESIQEELKEVGVCTNFVLILLLFILQNAKYSP